MSDYPLLAMALFAAGMVAAGVPLGLMIQIGRASCRERV